MNARPLTLLTALLLPCLNFVYAQGSQFYFDEAPPFGIKLQLDTNDSVWQVGPPQKTLFSLAASTPNALITDTINSYPINDTSSAMIGIDPTQLFWSIQALQWKQKIDFDADSDGGMLEFSTDGGGSWDNAFDNPFVYNFYGFDSTNVDTLPNGELGFVGTDSNWKDIWLCFDNAFFGSDTIWVRYTLLSDSNQNNGEGWMIDNFMVHVTIIHTVGEVEQEEYMKVYPTVTKDQVNIQSKKLDQYHIIEEMRLLDNQGRVVRSYGKSPTKFFIRIGDLPAGAYFLNIRTNLRSETFPIMLEK